MTGILNFTREVSFDYLKKGDHFVALAYFYDDEIPWYRLGVADMDGHAVSEDYGFRCGNMYYLEGQRNYINVKWEGVDYARPHVNSSIKITDGLIIYVNYFVYERIKHDMEINDGTISKQQAIEEAKEAAEDARKALRLAQDNYIKTVKTLAELKKG